jgi:hypothetical protein
MKKIITAAVLALATFTALAACPPHAPYNCVPGPNGKQICGCGR